MNEMARKNETPEEKAYRNMFQAATKAPDINVNILIPEARAAVSDYLSAVFHQDFDELPMQKMEEQFFNAVQDGIEEDINSGIERKLYELTLDDFRYEDSDSFLQHIAYRVVYSYDISYRSGQGGTSYDKAETRQCTITFVNDPRMGWIMCGYEDKGETKKPRR